MAYCQGRTDISDRVYVDLLSSAAAVMAYNDPHTGAMWMTQAVEISRRLGPDGRETLINNLRLLGDRYSSRGDFERALGSYAEAEALAFELWPEAADPVRYRQERAGWMGKRATIAYGQGDYVSAKRLAADSLSFMDAAEGSQWVWFTRITLADASVGLGELDAARAIYQESLRIADHATGDDQANYRGHMHRCLGMVDLLEGKLEAALEHAQQCLRYIIPIPDYNIMASDLALAALIAARQDRPTRAATLSGAAQAMYARQGRKPWEDSSLDALLPGWSSGGQRAAIAAAYAAGQAFTNDEAYTFALNAV
jgi:tetratricopeptide (TPR) repeat protein